MLRKSMMLYLLGKSMAMNFLKVKTGCFGASLVSRTRQQAARDPVA